MVLESNTAYLRRIIFCVLVALFCVSCDKEDEYVYLENTDFYGEWYATEINGQKVDSGQLSFISGAMADVLLSNKVMNCGEGGASVNMAKNALLQSKNWVLHQIKQNRMFHHTKILQCESHGVSNGRIP